MLYGVKVTEREGEEVGGGRGTEIEREICHNKEINYHRKERKLNSYLNLSSIL